MKSTTSVGTEVLSGNSPQLIDSAERFFRVSISREDRKRVHTIVNAARMSACATNWLEFPSPMNDDVSRRGCSPETHRNSLILLSDFSGVNLARQPKRVHTIVNAARIECVRHELAQVSSPDERRRLSARVLSGNSSCVADSAQRFSSVSRGTEARSHDWVSHDAGTVNFGRHRTTVF